MAEVKVRDVMTRKVVYLLAATPLNEAASAMRLGPAPALSDISGASPTT